MKVVGQMKKGRQSSEDDLDFEDSFDRNLPVYCDEVAVRRYRVFIDKYISEPENYRGVVNVLDKAGENDIVEFRLNTPGGNVLSAIAMVNAIKGCKATTVAIVEGMVASAGTLIMLACDNVIVTHHCRVMCHPAKYGAYGDMKDIKHQVKVWDDWLTQLTFSSYEHFLSVGEIEDMIAHSKEIWMDEAELVARLKRRQEVWNEQQNTDESEDYPESEEDGGETSAPARPAKTRTTKKSSRSK